MFKDLLLHIDHFSTIPETDDIEKYLKENYEDMGFIVSQDVVKQDPGLTSRFILFTGEYLEFNVIEDEDEFYEGKHANDDLMDVREENRPYAVGFITLDINKIYEHWRVRGYQVEDVSYVVPRDFDPEIEPETDPTWTFIPFPSTYAQGVKCYVIEYKKKQRADRYKFRMGENGIYAVNGLTLVTDYPHNRGEDWSNFFYTKNKNEPHLNECIMELPPHFIQWLTPQKFQMFYNMNFPESDTRIGELAVIHLFSKDLKYTKEYFEKKGIKVNERRLRFGTERVESIILERNEHDGFQFAISEKDPQEWLKERQDAVNEEFE